MRNNQEIITHLKEIGSTRNINRNEYILKAGDNCKHIYYVKSGTLVKTFLNKKGKEVIHGFYIDEFYPYILGANGIFFDNDSTFQIKAIENCVIVEFLILDLKFLIENFQEFALFFYSITESSFKNLYMFSSMRLSLSTEDFLMFLFKHHPVYMKRIPDSYIAEFLGVSEVKLLEINDKVMKTNLMNI